MTSVEFDQAAVKTLMAQVKTVGAQMGSLRGSVVFHEPKSAPAALPSLALWAGAIEIGRAHV